MRTISFNSASLFRPLAGLMLLTVAGSASADNAGTAAPAPEQGTVVGEAVGGYAGGKVERQTDRVGNTVDNRVDQKTDETVDKTLNKLLDKIFK